MKAILNSQLFLLVVLFNITSGKIFAQNFCPSDGPSIYHVETESADCYLVVEWPANTMPEIMCGAPGTPAPGTGPFLGTLIDSEITIGSNSMMLYDNGNGSSCSGALAGIKYHPTIPNAYITAGGDYCDAMNVNYIGFEMNRTGGSNFHCDIQSAAALPVEMTYFTGKESKGNIILEWGTAMELNSKAFYVEHSTEGKGFEEIGVINAAGNTTEGQDYSFVHREAVSGVNYYRLRQADFDGTSTYSEIISVKYAGRNPEIVVTPTIAKEEISIHLSDIQEETVKFEIYDTMGRKVMTALCPQGNHTQRLDISTLSKGHYFVRLGTKDDIKTNRFIKI